MISKNQTKSVLIVTTGDKDTFNTTQRGKELIEFAAEITKRTGIRVDYELISQLLFICDSTHLQIQTKAGKSLDEYSAVHLRNVTKFHDAAVAIATYCSSKGIAVTNHYDVAGPFFGKLSQMFLFAANGIPIPATTSSFNSSTLLDYIVANTPFSYPFILKANDGIKGNNNHLIQNEQQLRDVVVDNEKTFFVAQEYIPNDGDYRILLAGSHKPVVFKKLATNLSHLNNTSQGAAITMGIDAKLSSQIFSDSLRIQSLVKRELTGIDVVIKRDTDQYFFFEANDTPLITGVTAKQEKEVLLADYLTDLIKQGDQ